MNITGNTGDNLYLRYFKPVKNAPKLTFQKQKTVQLKVLNRDTFQLSTENPLLDNSLEVITLENPTEPDGYRRIDDKIVPYFKYKNFFPEKLNATPFSDIDKRLFEDVSIYDQAKAKKRLESFSRYLKEEMVGFITPDGENWFEGACKYLIKGSAGVDIPESLYFPYAKDFWGLMAHVDPFWTSNKFIEYLNNFKHTPAVDATIRAIRAIKMDQEARYSNVAFGYTSTLRFIPELLKGCAYTGEPMELSYKGDNSPLYPTLEHIFPHVEGGDIVNKDTNYVLTISQENSLRSDIPLTAFLRGWNADEYYRQYPDWKDNVVKKAAPLKEKQACFESLNGQERKQLNRILKDIKQGQFVALNKLPDTIRKAVAYCLRQQKEGLNLQFSCN